MTLMWTLSTGQCRDNQLYETYVRSAVRLTLQLAKFQFREIISSKERICCNDD